jgi:hypothetical protein
VDPSRQLHDLNPGITPEGLFWTSPVPRESVQVNLAAGTASMRLARTPMPDQQDIVNALHKGPSRPSTVSFSVQWSGPGRRKTIRDGKERFVAQIVENTSTTTWRAEVGGFTLESQPGSRSVYSLLGRERNGVFFR